MQTHMYTFRNEKYAGNCSLFITFYEIEKSFFLVITFYSPVYLYEIKSSF